MPTEVTRSDLRYSLTRKVKWRFLAKKMDRFKREYIVWLDRNNSEPTGQIERHFTAPIDIPDNFMSFPEDKPWRVNLDLDGYARYLKTARQEWEGRLNEYRAALRADQPDSKAQEKAGDPPQDWRLIVLLSRGDPWCLGITQTRTPAVEALIGPAPTAAQIREERARPRDLRLDPALEALIGASPAVNSSFPDEMAQGDDADDAELRSLVNRADPEIERRMKMDEALGLDEDELTGDVDIDLGLGANDMGDDLEEVIDAQAQGGKRVNPAKNRSRPDMEN